MLRKSRPKLKKPLQDGIPNIVLVKFAGARLERKVHISGNETSSFKGLFGNDYCALIIPPKITQLYES